MIKVTCIDCGHDYVMDEKGQICPHCIDVLEKLTLEQKVDNLEQALKTLIIWQTLTLGKAGVLQLMDIINGAQDD